MSDQLHIDPNDPWPICGECRHWQPQDSHTGRCTQLRERTEPLGLTLADEELPVTVFDAGCDRFTPATASQETRT